MTKYGLREISEVDLFLALNPHLGIGMDDLLFFRENRRDMVPSELPIPVLH
jgi:hypothetical protein